jgi:tetratricopeptide (TPR) repeat protein
VTRYTLAEVQKLVGMSAPRIRAYTKAGLVAEEGTWDFQDLVLLKTARRLEEQGVAPKRVQVALQELKARLPEGEALTAVGLSASGGKLIAERGSERWDALSGQALFEFSDSAAPFAASLRTIPTTSSPKKATQIEALSSNEWVELGRDLEKHAPHQARDAFRRALELEPGSVAIQLRLAALLERTGHVEAAAAHYRLILNRLPSEPTARTRLEALDHAT